VPRPSALPLVVFGTVAVLLVCGVALAWSAAAPEPGYLGLDVAVGLGCAAIGGLVLSRLPRQPIGWLFCVTALGLAAQAAAGGYAVAAHAGGWPLEAVAFWLTNWVFVIGLVPALLVLLLLPDGRLPSPAWRPVLVGEVVLGVALAVALMLRDKAWAWGVVVDNPVGRLSTDDVVGPAFGVVMVAAVVVGSAALVSRLHGDRGEAERRQMYPLLGAGLAIAVAVVVDTALPTGSVLGLWLVALALTTMPVAVAFSVFRHRLFEIEVVVRRTLVHVVASVVLLGVYVAVVAVVDVPILGAAVVAVAFAPVREQVQRALAHLLFGDRGDPGAALSLLGRRLEDASETPLKGAAHVVATTLRLPAAVVLDGAGRTVSAHGDVPADDLTVPLVAAGRTEGELRVARRSPDEQLSAADRTVLAELARPLALALATARLDEEVRRSRALVVSAREEERRRLRRELHDGLGPGLAAVGMELDLAIALAGEREDVGTRAMGRARGLAATLIGDVRRIVHELRPAALDELGLVGALEDLALTPGAGPRVRVEATALPELPAAVEVAAYRIAQEALANAVRHAAADVVTIAVDVDGAWLRVQVRDHGRGMPDRVVEGVGSASMRERAAEVGGRFWRGAAPGAGTLVRAELPWKEEV
jgi:signal transduction histidine kinase